MNKAILTGGIVVLILACVSMFCLRMSYNNKEIEYRNLSDAQRTVISTHYDEMWKILQQQAQVTNEYKDGFKEIFTGIIGGRYDKGDGSLMKWIQESNPNFDASMYKELMVSIKSERKAFTTCQDRMIDIVNQHKNLVTTEPSKWFISNVTPIEFTPITSSRTNNAMESGIDDEVDLFKK